MSVEDRLRFCMAPVHHRPDSLAPIVFRDYARQFAKRGVVRAHIRSTRNQDLSAVPTNPRRLGDMEEMYRVLEMYKWLATRYDCETKFPDLERSIQDTNKIADSIDAGLEIMSKDGLVDKTSRHRRRHSTHHRRRHRNRSRDNESSARRRARVLRRGSQVATYCKTLLSYIFFRLYHFFAITKSCLCDRKPRDRELKHLSIDSIISPRLYRSIDDDDDDDDDGKKQNYHPDQWPGNQWDVTVLQIDK